MVSVNRGVSCGVRHDARSGVFVGAHVEIPTS